jgi:rhomboid protease GluP
MEQPLEPHDAVSGDLPAVDDVTVQPEVPVPYYRRNPVTSVFSALLVVVYLASSAPNHFQGLINRVVYWGSFYGPAVQSGEWWRFLTATLLHDNPMHLFSNVFGILAFGGLIEPVIGSRKLVALYLFSLASGLLLSWLLNPQAVTIGASTIDYGLIGAYLTIALLLRFQLHRGLFFRELRGALLFILIFTLWNAMESEHINMWAHIGGLGAGIIFSFLIWPRKKASMEN